MITKILNTCRMCSKHFVLTWEKHEVQEPHFTDNKEIKTNANWFLFVGCTCITLWFFFSTRYCWLCLGIGNGRGERASMRLATKSRNNPNELGIKNKQTLLKETIYQKSNSRRSGQRWEKMHQKVSNVGYSCKVSNVGYSWRSESGFGAIPIQETWLFTL